VFPVPPRGRGKKKRKKSLLIDRRKKKGKKILQANGSFRDGGKERGWGMSHTPTWPTTKMNGDRNRKNST